MRSVRIAAIPCCLAALLSCTAAAAPREVREAAASTRAAFRVYRKWAQRGASGEGSAQERREYERLGDSLESALSEIEAWTKKNTGVGEIRRGIEARENGFSQGETAIEEFERTIPETDLRQ